jgi:hypothetical protein
MMFTPTVHRRRAPVVHVTVGPNGIRATGTTDGSIGLDEVHDELCRRVRAQAPYAIGPINVAEVGLRRVVVDARRIRRPFGD